MKKFDFFCIIMIFAFFSCDKGDSWTNNNEEIKTGDYSGLLVKSYDTIIAGGYHMLREYSLDVNNDDVYDFKLSSEIFGSPGMGQHPQAKIMSLNSNSLFHGIITNDSIFHYEVIDISTYDNKTYKTTYHKYTCDKDDDPRCLFSYLNQEYFKFSYFDPDEIISVSDDFQADTIDILPHGSTEVSLQTEKNDTIFQTQTTYSLSCNYFPYHTFKYVGIKIKEGNKEKIGWIKLGVYDTINFIILETAIQK